MMCDDDTGLRLSRHPKSAQWPGLRVTPQLEAGLGRCLQRGVAPVCQAAARPFMLTPEDSKFATGGRKHTAPAAGAPLRLAGAPAPLGSPRWQPPPPQVPSEPQPASARSESLGCFWHFLPRLQDFSNPPLPRRVVLSAFASPENAAVVRFISLSCSSLATCIRLYSSIPRRV